MLKGHSQDSPLGCSHYYLYYSGTYRLEPGAGPMHMPCNLKPSASLGSVCAAEQMETVAGESVCPRLPGSWHYATVPGCLGGTCCTGCPDTSACSHLPCIQQLLIIPFSIPPDCWKEHLHPSESQPVCSHDLKPMTW